MAVTLSVLVFATFDCLNREETPREWCMASHSRNNRREVAGSNLKIPVSAVSRPQFMTDSWNHVSYRARRKNEGRTPRVHNPCYEIESDRYTFVSRERRVEERKIVTITFLFSEKACIGFTLEGEKLRGDIGR